MNGGNLGRSREPSPGGIPEFPLAANSAGNFFSTARYRGGSRGIGAAASRGCDEIPYAMGAWNVVEPRREFFRAGREFIRRQREMGVNIPANQYVSV
jgi:hypothetical protein